MGAVPLELGFGAGQLYRQAADEEAVKSLAEVAMSATNIEAKQQQMQLAAEAAGQERELHPLKVRKATAEVTKLEDEAEAERKLLQGMQSLAKAERSGEPLSNSEYFYQLAERAAAAGSLTKATEYRKLAGQADRQEAQNLASGARASRDAIVTALRQNELAGSVLADVKDQATLDAANARFQQLTGETMLPPGTQYSPQLVDFLRNGALTRSQQLRVQHERALEQQGERRTRSYQASVESGNTYRRMNYELAKRREERLAKAGGKVAGTPTKEEKGQVSTTLETEFPNLSSDDRKQAVQDIASDAKVLRRANPALSWNEATRQAIENARKAGDLYNESRVFGYGQRTRYQGGGKSAKTPMPLPTLHDGKPNTDKLRDGRYYVNASGLLAKYVAGKGFQPVDASETEDDDEGDDEGAK